MKNFIRTDFLVIAIVSLFFVACNSSGKIVNYNKVILYDVSDYVLKMNLLFDYLNDFESDAEDMCINVVPDLEIFEMDIRAELDEADNISNQQVDTLRDILDKTIALRRFLNCIANCEKEPRITFEQLRISAEIMGYSMEKTGQKSFCAKVFEVQKDKFLFYFVVNETSRVMHVNYSYRDFYGKLNVGIKDLKSYEAAVAFRIFNSESFDRADFLRMSCK